MSVGFVLGSGYEFGVGVFSLFFVNIRSEEGAVGGGVMSVEEWRLCVV